MYATNRQRTIQYALTIVFDTYDHQLMRLLETALNHSEHVVSMQTMATGRQFAHVYYKLVKS